MKYERTDFSGQLLVKTKPYGTYTLSIDEIGSLPQIVQALELCPNCKFDIVHLYNGEIEIRMWAKDKD